MAVLSRRTRAIPTIETDGLRSVALRTRALRWPLAAAALGFLAAGFLFARGLDEQGSGLVPPGTSAVVVLDVSLSITDRDFRRSRRVIERLIASRTPVGLVVFSDVPYELLPPRTPARELRPLLRLLTPEGGRLPPNPWQTSFSAGTLISASLDLAQRMLRRDQVERGSILLVSDLQTAPADYGELGRTLRRLRRSPISVRVVPLSPLSDGVKLFETLLGREAFLDSIEPSAGDVPRIESSLHGRLPLGLLVTGALLFLALASHERYASRLALPRASGRGL